MTILDELDWRGLIAQSTDLDALAAATAQGPLTLYAGFDPTAPSLHAGNLLPLLALRRFQRAGHRPIVLAGGATGMIGDPREAGERTLNTADTVAEWTERIRGQLERFVDFDDTPTGAIIENNLTWTRELSAVEFLRDVGKHFSVNVMLDRDTIRRRLDGEGISYTEFSYMLLQANDYVELHRRHGCALQIGGSDQWGNIIAGVRLVRQRLGATVHALTVPLVTAADGTKFGKSTGGGSLWLDPELTSPYAWYQYFVNTADADVIRYLRWFTFLSADELAELAARPRTGPRSAPPSGGWPASSPRWCMARRPPRRSSTPARRCSAGGSCPGSTRPRWRPRCGRPRWPSWRPAVRTASWICWSPPDSRRARARRDARSARAGCRSTTSGSTATSGCRSAPTSCTTGGWCCAAASATWPASSAPVDLEGGRIMPSSSQFDSVFPLA
ncbi:Tyrosine--tRNA ligase [Mycobacterium talmoniae]|uniref:Tyrosine--tRNA ligase n=1 Tax=Mycobacterium talmoniae TaxID=1858794 RepID=A0A2S8BC84_9MYCO|nr:Tyrosine--tRNA ligase [Mycobacterium talmoniae]